MVHTDNDRHILELPRQLELGLVLSNSIGGQLKSSVIHSINFTTICSVKALNVAWKKFSDGKKSRRDVQKYQKHLVDNVQKLHDSLVNETYKHGLYHPFVICDPKRRQIHKATVCDRLVHQAIVSAVEPIFEKRFIFDSYSCRVGKGTHAGVARLRLFLRKASRNNSQKVYVLKCDVRQFFATIDHKILMNLIQDKISDYQTIRLLQTILSSHEASIRKGIPLGNVTSQLFANIYLHELDWFGNKVFWKIDYYDSAFELWADPLSSECHRVLTVMLADEY